MAGGSSPKEVGDSLADRLAEVDPLWAAECGLPIDRLPSLDPEWWLQRRSVFAKAESALRSLPQTRDRDILIERTGAELQWIDSGEATCELQAAMDGTLFRLRFVLDNLPAETDEQRERRRSVEASLPAALDGFRRTLNATSAGRVVATRRQVLSTINAIGEWVAAGVPASASFAVMADYLRAEYLPLAADADCVGSERFEVWARRYTGAAVGSADYEWAAAELASAFEQLTEIRRELADAPVGLVLTSEAEHIAWAEGQLGRATSACVRADILPQREWPRLTVRSFDGGGQQAYYAPRAADGSTNATVWIAGGDGPHHVEYEKTLLFHESIPGHHVEATLQSEATGLSRYQRLMYLPGHSEGWGLYAESLAEDAGLIDTPQAKAGRLGSRALRLASLLIDLGFHTSYEIPRQLVDRFGTKWSADAAQRLLEAVGLESDVAAWWFTSMIGRPAHRAAYVAGERAWTDLVTANRRVPRSRILQEALGSGPMGLDQFRPLGRELTAMLTEAGAPDTQ
ncbi:MAG TPA: DUF885 family protein [Acidimicrobiales bacterium]|nr:DUF885 family protein [Acidimicrobiales bacterium]